MNNKLVIISISVELKRSALNKTVQPKSAVIGTVVMSVIRDDKRSLADVDSFAVLTRFNKEHKHTKINLSSPKVDASTYLTKRTNGV